MGGMCIVHRMQKLFQRKNRKTQLLRMNGVQKRFFASYMIMVFMMMWCTTPVLAAGDPLAVVDNLSDFIFSLIRAIGLILLGFGVVQIGLSLKSHDPSQRANGFLTLAGGVIITFAKEILDLIMV
ncbi:glutamyl-tRNA amidotransferase [[Ruminococcus] gnavus]|uniref:Glutamyl-tRNA amidotransferase n=1 Tax=Mediterraneibacter gnavus TaxID=33038 RepID=A0AAW6DDR6_MEDGN|nr:glutamyl-tRNA amidotransferase [Mediterraneibacter gnavus]MDB8680814.1 glutamyl-tRNA amidotransferase [Mediterraneibacter gnavus]MDB8687895.1 glutamyl-tRNA amidotransferase [Mediterraneibacter gnavus]MDB8691967.1 glutamyl-tRNA amidotransferase [Mediterraneibacter gnavus]MDU2007866.1 glutamyl-tRNA amidotransferase [Lachnospiraceae bacterium]